MGLFFWLKVCALSDFQDTIVFYDAKVLLGQKGVSQTEKPLRLIGYEIEGIQYWVASDRFDLTAEQIAFIYKLRWDIETFFAWWKRHLKVYHLISRSRHGLMIQMLAGLITYLLLAIYCHEEHGEPVSIKRVRQLRNKILNESRVAEFNEPDIEPQDINSTSPFGKPAYHEGTIAGKVRWGSWCWISLNKRER